MEEDAGPCLPFNVRTSIHGPLYILHAFRRWLPWLHLSKRSLRLDLVVPKCQGRRVRRQFCSANDPRKDLLSLAFLPLGSGKGTTKNGVGQPE